MIKLWIDDLRPAPEGYVLCRSVHIAIAKIENAENIVANAKYAIADYETNYKHTDSPLKEDYEKYTIPKLKQNIANYQIELIDVDHDLGDYAQFGGDGVKLLDWLEETGRNYPIRIHSQNPVGVENMRRIIQRNGWKEIK